MIKLDTSNHTIAKNIVELQRKSYKVEADLIGFYEIPPLKESIEELMKSRELFYGFYFNEQLAGIISYEVEKDILDICRVAVDPLYFRRGIAEEMLSFILSIDANISKVIVSTGALNEPAKRLYIKHGFRHISDEEVATGCFISSFEKLTNKNTSS